MRQAQGFQQRPVRVLSDGDGDPGPQPLQPQAQLLAHASKAQDKAAGFPECVRHLLHGQGQRALCGRNGVGRRQKFIFFIVQDLSPGIPQLLGKAAGPAAEKAAAGDGPLCEIAAVQDRLALQTGMEPRALNAG